MAVIQTSKILMRRGNEIELPGSPISLTPLRFNTGLDIGEFGYAVDSGRLFIGHAPNVGQPNYKRTTFPYQGVEILTEASTETIRKMFNFMRRDVGRSGFYHATLVPTDEWRDVIVDDDLGFNRPYRFRGPDVIAKLDYYALTDDGANNASRAIPVRQGTLRILSDEVSEEALISDEGISTRRTDLGSPDALDAEIAYENVTFRVIRSLISSEYFHRLQYKNALNVALDLYFDVRQPTSDASTY